MLKVKKNPTTCQVGQVWKYREVGIEKHFVFVYGPDSTLVGVKVGILHGGLFLRDTNRYTEHKVGAHACLSWEFVGMATDDT